MILGAEKPWMESEAQNSIVNGIKTPGRLKKKSTLTNVFLPEYDS